MRYLSRYVALATLLALVAFGCRETPDGIQRDSGIQAPGLNAALVALNTETLGDINIPLAPGTGVVVAGVGLVGDPNVAQPGTININVPGEVKQVLLYWTGHNATEGGDGDVEVNGVNVSGELLGGPTLFFSPAWSTTYRADITDMDVVGMGANAVDISGMEYTTICPWKCQNLGAGLLVIYDDGSAMAQIAIKDGNDNAYFDFDSPLDTTVPQIFNFPAAATDRVATLSMFAGSVKQFPTDGGRPNVVEITLSDGTVIRKVDVFQGNSGNDFDAVTVDVDIPAGITSMTVQALSEKDPTSNFSGLPASFGWLAAAAVIPPGDVPPGEIGDYVWCDLNNDGVQDPNEPGIPGVTVNLVCTAADGTVTEATTTTNDDGMYLFTNVPAGACVVTVDPASPSVADKVPGDHCPIEIEVDLGPGDSYLDADFCFIFELGEIGDYVWCDLNNDGVQDPDEPAIPGVTVNLSCVDTHGNQITATTTTDDNGLYLFTDVPAGMCVVTVDPASPSVADKVPGDHCPIEIDVDLGPGESYLDADFCFIYPPVECGPCEGKVTVLTLQYNGSVDNAMIRVEQKKDDVVVFNDVVQPGGLFTFVGEDKKGTLGTEIRIYVNGALNTKIHTSCSQPIGPGLVSGDFLVIAGESREGGPLCPIDDDGGNGGEGCEVGKPAVLTMKYTGESCDASDHSQDDGKVTCSGDPDFAPMVMIKVTDKKEIDDDKAKVFFEGQVALNAEFDITASYAGEDKLKSNTFVYIMDLDGNVLQSVGFHTSCSQPLNLNDQFGSLLLTGFVPFVK